MKRLILASSSKYRGELMKRLKLPFEQQSPDLDEIPQQGESPEGLARRLAREKAGVLARQHPDAWVIGSDQVPSLDGRILGKPGTREVAAAQLREFSGRTVAFDTAVALVHGQEVQQALDRTEVHFRSLRDDEIERYLDAEPAYDCAGSFQAEGLGISLFEAIESGDPTALIGLPMIPLSRMLRDAGFALP